MELVSAAGAQLKRVRQLFSLAALKPSSRRPCGLRAGAVAIAVTLMGGGPTAMAAQADWQVPTQATSMVTAPLMSPSAAWSAYGAAIAHTPGYPSLATTTPDLAALARNLGAARTSVGAPDYVSDAAYIQNVFDYVRHNVAMEFRFELAKGGRGALIDQSGTAFDQADLMVKLIRQRPGLTANYRIGTISITPAQFGAWSGFVKNLNPANQSFDVDAKAACQFLADGGIPAVVNGVSDCASVSGLLTGALTLGHVWVEAAGNLYDPAFKRHTLKAGIDLATAASCGSGCGSAAKTAALTGGQVVYSPGSYPSVRYLNEANLGQKLLDYAQHIEGALRVNPEASELEEALGGISVDLGFAPTVSSALPYTSATQYAVSEVPRQFRAKLRVQSNSFDVTLYADEIAGRSVRTYDGKIYVDSLDITAAPSALCSSCGLFTSSTEYPIPNSVKTIPYTNLSTFYTVSAFHAYPTASADHREGEIRAFLPIHYWPTSIIAQWGDASSSTVEYYRGKLAADQAGPANNNNNTFPFWSDSTSYFADIVARQSQAKALLAAANSTSVTAHHTIGLSHVANVLHAVHSTTTSVAAVSVQPRELNAPLRDATFETLAGVYTLAEREISTGWLEDIPARFSHFNRLGATFVGAPASLALPGVSAYANDNLYRINATHAEGYNYILSFDGTAGCEPLSAGSPVPGTLCMAREQEPSYAYKAGKVSYRVANLYKGASISLPVPEAAKPPVYGLREKKYLEVDTAKGAMRLRPAPDLVTGTGPFPHTLTFERYYDSEAGGSESSGHIGTEHGGIMPTSSYVPPVPALVTGVRNVGPELGSGWSNNWTIGAKVSSGFEVAFGAGEAVSSSYALAAALTLKQLHMGGQFDDRITGIFVLSWLREKIFGNTITVYKPPLVESFARVPSSEPIVDVAQPPTAIVGYQAPPGSQSRLLVTRTTPVGPQNAGGEDVYFAFPQFAVSYIDGAGSKIHFGRPTTSGAISLGNDQMESPETTLQPKNWEFPTGERIDFTFSFPGMLSKVENNMGRWLSFTYENVPDIYQDRLVRVSDENGRYADFNVTGCTRTLMCSAFSARSLGQDYGARYEYAADVNSPNPSVLLKAPYRLRRIFSPRFGHAAYQTIRYDQYLSVERVTDILGRVTTYYPGSLFGVEAWKRAEMFDADNKRTQWVYNDRSNLLRSVDALGRVASFTYDGLGRKLSETRPELDATSYQYDIRSNVTRVRTLAKPGSAEAGTWLDTTSAFVGAASIYTCAEPARCNKPTAETDARGAQTTYAWNSLGQLTSITRPEPTPGAGQPQTTAVYEPVGTASISMLKSITQQISGSTAVTTSYVYSPLAKYVLSTQTVEDVENVGNLQTSYIFDAVGNVEQIDPPGPNAAIVYRWDKLRRLTHEIKPNPSGSEYLASMWTYDSAGLMQTAETGLSNAASTPVFTAKTRKTYEYDAIGNTVAEYTLDLTASPVKRVAVTQTRYDNLDRAYCVAVRMSDASMNTLPGDACQMGSSSTGEPDRVIQNEYDAVGQLTAVHRALGVMAGDSENAERFGYTPNGKRAFVLDARRNQTDFIYDGFDRLVRQQFPHRVAGSARSDAANYEQYQYDPNGNRTGFRRRDGLWLNYTYDSLNRLMKKAVGDVARDVYYGYDRMDRMTYARFGTSSGGGTEFSYDRAGRLLMDRTFTREIHSGYDASGNRTSLIAGGAGLTYAYDVAGRLTNIIESGGGMGLIAISYDPSLGLRKTMTRGNGSIATYSYDGALRLKSLAQSGPANQPSFLQTLDYNPASQVVASTQQDPAYIWTARPAEQSQTHDGMNRIASIAELTAGGYDGRGNLINDGVREFKYDRENRLISAEDAGGKLIIEYDPLGRVAVTTREAPSGVTGTVFQYDGDRLIGEYSLSSGAVLRRYVHGDRTDEPLVMIDPSAAENDKRTWLHADRQGSVIAVSKMNQIAPYTYDPYGAPHDWGGQRFRYTGQIAFAEAQLYHYKARAYDPVMGRFLQTDPIGFEGGDTNLYAYVGGDPENRTDPLGLEADCPNIGNCEVDGVTVTAAKKPPPSSVTMPVESPRPVPRPGPAMLERMEQLRKYRCAIWNAGEAGADWASKGVKFGFATQAAGYGVMGVGAMRVNPRVVAWGGVTTMVGEAVVGGSGVVGFASTLTQALVGDLAPKGAFANEQMTEQRLKAMGLGENKRAMVGEVLSETQDQMGVWKSPC